MRNVLYPSINPLALWIPSFPYYQMHAPSSSIFATVRRLLYDIVV